MALNIWYQSLGDPDAWTGYGSHLRAMIERFHEADTTVEVHGTTNGIAAQYRYLDHLATREVIDNLHQAIDRGFDAFLIGNFYDPGLQICREIAEIPVLSLGETSYHIASLMGASFMVAAPNEKGASRIHENIVSLGFSKRLHTVQSLGAERILDLRDAFVDKEALTTFVKNFHAAVTKSVVSGAEVVIPGGGVLMTLLGIADVHVSVDGVPIVNGIASLVKMGETVAKLNKLSEGRFVSKRLTYRPPQSSLIDEIRASYGEGVYPTVDPNTD